MNKMLRILETVWLFIGIAGIVLCIYSLINSDKQQAVYFLVFTAVSAIMFYVRRRQRKDLEKTNQAPSDEVQQ